MKTALITGVTGQDGAYLSAHLVGLGYRVVGTSRDAARADTRRLAYLGVADRVEIRSASIVDRVSLRDLIEDVGPDEIYALAGQSSVSASFSAPVETYESVVGSVLNLLEALRDVGGGIRLFHPGSSESFGDVRGTPATEETPLRPSSPYGVAKASAQLLVSAYRQAYGLFAANGILFNHESPLRPDHFVTRKITRAVSRIADGSGETLTLARLDIVRDWGLASEYVDAMWRILQQQEADDFIVATGTSCSLEDFVAAAFAARDLDWRAHVAIDGGLARATDPQWSGADVTKAASRLGWAARTSAAKVAAELAETERDVPFGSTENKP